MTALDDAREEDDTPVAELRMAIASALHHANRVHRSRGCIGCDWCTLKSLLEGYNAEEDIAEMGEWLTDRHAAFSRYRIAEAKLAALEAQPRPRIRAVIEANIGNASNPHSWRCENPDRFPGYCRCVDEITDEVVAALAEPVPDTRSDT